MFGASPSFASQSASVMGFALGGEAGSAPQAAARKARQEDKQTCLPVTIRAVERALEQRADTGAEALSFHGTEPGMLILVGAVEAMARHAASIEFSLNDATGRIKARYYVSDRQPKDLEELAPGRHVSVFGGIRTAPEVHLAVTGMRLVQSADEVSFHLIEAAHAALRLRKGHPEPETPSKQPATARTAATMAGSAPMDLSPQKSERPQAELTAPVAPASEPAKPRAALSGEGLRKAVFAFLQREGDGRPEGVSLAAICNHADPAPADEVSAALELLVNDGEVYTTIDDGHFQCV
mmetsp:Transcript_16060/g.50479  ORF Transcript_16060/g.50479 Transcript_16060/m.50479 type:complete len:295 (+) Transcript_16060:69-953(+)